MKQILRNLIKVFLNKTGILGIIIGIAIVAIPSYYFTGKQNIVFNLGVGTFIVEVTLSIIIAILFGVFLGATLYKIKYFSVGKRSGFGFFGGFLGVLVAGCPACSITLSSFFGLAWLLAFLPYHGLELKFISVLFLLYACYSTLKNLEVCNLKIKKPKK